MREDGVEQRCSGTTQGAGLVGRSLGSQVARAGTDLNFPLVVVENIGLDKTRPVLYSDWH